MKQAYQAYVEDLEQSMKAERGLYNTFIRLQQEHFSYHVSVRKGSDVCNDPIAKKYLERLNADSIQYVEQQESDVVIDIYANGNASFQDHKEFDISFGLSENWKEVKAKKKSKKKQ